MAIDIPTSSTTVVNRALDDVGRNVQGSSPTLRNSWIRALIVAFANRVFDSYTTLRSIIREALPSTAVTFLNKWGAVWGLNPTVALTSSGELVVFGTNTSAIPIETQWTTVSGEVYESTAAGTIAAQTIGIDSITLTSDQYIVLCDADHGLSTGAVITISGCTTTDYNTTWTVTGDGSDTFILRDVPAGTSNESAASSGIADWFADTVNVVSKSLSEDADLLAFAQVTITSSLSGILDVAGMDYLGSGGGADAEDAEAFRLRLEDRIHNPIAHFSESDIIAVAKAVPGVTRVFVQKITPVVGQVTIYFMRDNDADPIPSPAEVATVDAAIQAIRPANTEDTDVIVDAPTEVPVAFTLDALAPNTTSMQSAINTELLRFFAENTTVGVNIQREAYLAAINNTVDTTTGDTVTSFNVTVPAGDVTIASDEIGTRDTVTFP